MVVTCTIERLKTLTRDDRHQIWQIYVRNTKMEGV